MLWEMTPRAGHSGAAQPSLSLGDAAREGGAALASWWPNQLPESVIGLSCCAEGSLVAMGS